MSVTKVDTICPLCGNEIRGNINRLVTDSCGHSKCRRCLLADDECTECSKLKKCNTENNKDQTTGVDAIVAKVAVETNHNTMTKNIRKKGRKVVTMPSHIQRLSNDLDSSVRYYCTHCGKKFGSRTQQYYHLSCGSEDSKKYKCLQCAKTFSTKSHFKYHMETHEKHIHHCRECNKSFANRIVLQKHEKLHHAPSLQCTECSKSFRNKESLSGHARLIHGDKDLPYKCEVCEKSYALKSTLKQHIQKHLDKKYACQYCDKRFQRNYTLKLHLKKHTKTDCYICGICLCKFSDNAVLLRHVKLHQDAVKYRCRECDATIMRKDNMLRHIRTIHPNRTFENCVEITSPINSKPLKAIESDEYLRCSSPISEPKTVENSAVIKCIGNVQPMKVPTYHVSTILTPNIQTTSTQTDIAANISKNDSTIIMFPKVPLNGNVVTSGTSTVVQKKVKKYDPIKMYRKILTSDRDESATESESEKEEVYSINPLYSDNTGSCVSLTTPEKQVTINTSNFSEMHWRKNFRYTYQYQDF
ncbi:zinc finger protein 28 [Zeugodacus cucurbitae]|uniref:Zinc finger protein 320 n=2 Tax=Zeugodacus cucurbitae TaxID=28588 RepID=A0A0A1XH69_ZEUCU|nr:zinc finger protein 28 [Zeugodacus cucurbitae]